MKLLKNDAGELLTGYGGGFLTEIKPSYGQIDFALVRKTVEGVNVLQAIMGGLFQDTEAYFVSVLRDGNFRSFWIRDVAEGARILGPTASILNADFAENGWNEVTVAIKIAGVPGLFPVETITPVPAAPGPVHISGTSGPTPGTIVVTIEPDLPSPGDGAEVGDDDGGVLTYTLVIDGDTEIELEDVTASKSYLIDDLVPDAQYELFVRADSVYRSGTVLEPITVRATPDVEPVIPAPTFIGGTLPSLPLTINLVAGNNLSINVRNYFDGEVSADVISGVSGGAYSDPNYTASALAQGNYTIQMTGTNAGGTATGTVNVVVAAAIIAPSLKSGMTPPNFLKTVGDAAVSHNFAQYFNGSDPKTYSSPQDAADALFTVSSAGVWQTTALNTLRTTGAVQIVCTNSAGSASLSFNFGVGEAPRPAKLTVGTGNNVRSVQSYNRWPGYRTDRLAVTGLEANCVLEWSTSNLGSDGEIADANWEPCTLVGSYHEMFMTNPDRNISPEGQPLATKNFSVFSESENPRAAKRRFRQRNTVTGMASVPSEPLAVPAVPVDPVLTDGWLPAVLRYRRAWETGNGGNPGQQFERVVCWNQGVLDPDKLGDLFGGQDENNVWMMTNGTATGSGPDGVALFGSPIADGLFVQNIGGIYANSDDNIVLVLGNGGLFRSDDWANTFYKVTCMRGGVEGMLETAQGASVRSMLSMIWRRPQRFVGGVPQLTHAQRPIWILEQVRGAGNAIVQIYVWKSVDNAQSFQMQRQLSPVSDYVGTSKSQAMKALTVAPNGDVMIAGNKGVFVSTDGFATDPTKCQILGNTNPRDIVAVGWRGGDHNTPSGAYAAINASSNAGVVRTDNIRTTGFTRPATQTAAIANFTCIHMGVSPVNTDRLIICGGKQNPQISTDGGVKWSEVTDNAGTGDGSGRYAIGGDAGGVYFHPSIEDIVFATTGQTVTRSINGGARFDGDRVAYFDGSHDKGFGFDPRGNWKKFGFVQQDYVLRYTDAGFDYFRNSGVDKAADYGQGAGQGTPPPMIAKGLTNLGDAMIQAGVGDGGYTSGNGCILCPNNRFIVGVNRHTADSQNTIIIEENPRPDANPSSPDDGNLRWYILREDLGLSRMTNCVNHPTDEDMVFMGRFRVSNLGAPSRSLPNNPFKFTHGSSIVEVSCPGHGYSVGDKPSIVGSSIFRGTATNLTTDDIIVWGRYPITNVVNANTFRIDVGRNATIAGGAGQTAQAGGNSVGIIGEPTFSSMTRQIVDMFRLNNSTISYWVNDGNKSSSIHRSTANNGGNQELWFQTANQFKGSAIAADPFNAERVIYSRDNLAQNGIVREIVRFNGNLTDRTLKDSSGEDVNLRSLAKAYLDGVLGERLNFTNGSVAPSAGATITKGGASGVAKYAIVTSGSWQAGNAAGYVIVTGRTGSFTAGAITSGMTATISGAQQVTYSMPDVSVDFIVCDHNNPGWFVALLNGHGVPNWWQTEDNGVTWENISGFLPRTVWRALVHPETSDLIGMSSKGRFIRPAHANVAAIPDRRKAYDQVAAFYARSDVPNPRVY